MADLLRTARERARLTVEELARWARVAPDELRRAEDGDARLTAPELDQCARVFGLRLEDLLAGEAGNAPMTLLLRASDAPFDFRSVLTSEIDFALGEFQRVVRDIHEVELALGDPISSLPTIVAGPVPPGKHEGEYRAERVRLELGLGDDPISSVRDLVRRLGVAVISVTSEQVDTSLDGACTRAPRPAILINLLEEGATWPWRARVTLAHELGHLLFDMASRERQVLVSPSGKTLPGGIDHLEQIARAFAACLLVPTAGVRGTVAGRDPTSEDAITAVGRTYGVGRTLAINRLQQVFGLRGSQRLEMDLRIPRKYDGDFSADAPPLPNGFRGQPLLGLLRRAVAEQRIGAARARRMLALGPTDPLPFTDLGAMAAPAVAREAMLMRRANEYLAERHPGLVALDPQRTQEGTWRLDVAASSIGSSMPPTGFIILNDSGTPVRDEADSSASP